MHLFERRTLWWPTLLGWAILAFALCAPAALWCFCGEYFLSPTQRLPAQVLVVEGWIGSDALNAAQAEFKKGGYQYVVTTSGLTGDRWDKDRVSYAVIAARQLVQSGISRDKIIVATPRDSEAQRTYQSAVAVGQALHSHKIDPSALMVFTFGTHARRSRLVFAKVLDTTTRVGVISWVPPGYFDSPWWRSSDRANELIRETAGYLYERFLSSGRFLGPPRATDLTASIYGAGRPAQSRNPPGQS
jgi:uncharacterized SAM-binding protein YcdF (DUF218 family)